MSTEEKIIPATQQRRKQAKESGQRPTPSSLPGALGLLMLVLGARLIGTHLGPTVVSLATIAWHGEPVSGAELKSTLLALLFVPAAVVGGGVFLAGVVVGKGQVTFPRLHAPNPIQNLQQMWGADAVVRWGRAGVSGLGVLAVAVGPTVSLVRAGPVLLGAPMGVVSAVAHTLFVIFWRGATVLVLVGIGEVIYRQWSFEKTLKMTHQEAKEDRRSSEGDPMLKAQRKRRHVALIRQQQVAAVKTAAVVIVNPEHYAVALRYRTGERAPVVVARGVDTMALMIRQAAWNAGVPVREQATLARALYGATRVGQPVPPELYRAIAVVLAWAYKRKRRSA